MRQLGLQNFAHLIDDVSKPAFYRRPLTETNLWISQAGCVSALHFDFLDNLLCQIKGHKTITLYAPAQTAEQGNRSAQFNLGWAYYKGNGVKKDDQKAKNWFRIAAEQGGLDAKYNLKLLSSDKQVNKLLF